MNERHRAILRMLLCAVLWSTGGMLIKLIPWNAFALVGARGLIAGVTIFLYMRCRRIPFKLSKQTLLVATGVAGLFVCFVSATKLTTAANAVVIQYTGPMFFLLYCAIFRKQRFRAADYGIVIVTTLGIGMFFFGDLGGGAAIGNVVALFSGLFFTLNLVASGDADEVERLNGFLQAQLLCALIGLPFFLTTSPVFTLETVGCLLLLGVFQVGASYILYALALRACPPLACSLLATLEPLLNPVWVFLTVGELPGTLSLVSGALVVAAITLWCVYNDRHPIRSEAETLRP